MLCLVGMVSFLLPFGVSAGLEGEVEIIGNSDLTEQIGTARDNHQHRYEYQFTSGSATSSAQVDGIYRAIRTLSTGASEGLDLSGTLENPLGSVITFSRIRSMIIENQGTTTITIGSAPANPWYAWSGNASSTIAIPASSAVCFSSPYGTYTVTAGTADILQITNSAGGTGTYKIWILGND